MLLLEATLTDKIEGNGHDMLLGLEEDGTYGCCEWAWRVRWRFLWL